MGVMRKGREKGGQWGKAEGESRGKGDRTPAQLQVQGQGGDLRGRGDSSLRSIFQTLAKVIKAMGRGELFIRTVLT